jgi:hypothetical protein
VSTFDDSAIRAIPQPGMDVSILGYHEQLFEAVLECVNGPSRHRTRGLADGESDGPSPWAVTQHDFDRAASVDRAHSGIEQIEKDAPRLHGFAAYGRDLSS